MANEDIERASKSDFIETDSDPNEFGRSNRDHNTITERTERTETTTGQEENKEIELFVDSTTEFEASVHHQSI